MADTQDRFAFGKNWENFLTKFSQDRLVNAQDRLLKLLRLSNLAGKTFLDIGSGSGLHSLSAWHSGAGQVVSFDYDPDSVNATRSLWEMAGKPENWCILQGSVLDADFMCSLGSFDIVYSWGVLHHTGDMWQAIRNARLPLADNGVFCIALYSDTAYRDNSLSGEPTPEQWLEIKQEYNAANANKKRRMEYGHVWRTFLRPTLRNPLRFLLACYRLLCMKRQYAKQRGMDFWTDIRDWLGGWPMDFVKEGELIRLGRTELGLEFLDIITGEGNTEFLFRPLGSTNYWDTILSRRVRHNISGPFQRAEGYMWSCAMPELTHCADTETHPRRSSMMLFEDELPLGYPHARHVGICRFGEGRYSHWKDTVLFSTSDNTDPNVNGRVYAALLSEASNP